MYNEKLKKWYIGEKETSTITPKKYLEKLFTKTEEYETNYKKDIYDFNFYEIESLYKALNFESYDAIEIFNSHLNNYTNFCLQQSLVKDNQNHFVEFDSGLLSKYVNKAAIAKKIISREQLNRWLNDLINVSDAFLFEALFEGIQGSGYKNLAFITIEDFRGNVYIDKDGKKIQVTDKLVALAEESSKTYIYYPIKANSKKECTFKDEKWILKRYCNVSDDMDLEREGRRIYRQFRKCAEYLDVPYLKPKDLIKSGRIHYINTRCKELGMTAEAVLNDYKYLNEVNQRFEPKIKVVPYLREYGDYLV